MARKGKKKAGTCLECGKALRVKDRKCRRCGQPSPLFTGKAAGRLPAPAFLGKSARPYLVKSQNVTPLIRRSARAKALGTAKPACWTGCPPGKRGHSFCVSCGEPYGITYAQHADRVFKAADPLGSGYWGARAQREADPGQREVYRELARTEAVRAAGGEGAFLAKTLGYRSLADAVARETDPATAPWLRQAEADYYRNGGGAA